MGTLLFWVIQEGQQKNQAGIGEGCMCVCACKSDREREFCRCYLAGFEGGERGQEPGNLSGFQKLLKETDSPQQPPEGAKSCGHLDFNPVRAMLDLRLQEL